MYTYICIHHPRRPLCPATSTALTDGIGTPDPNRSDFVSKTGDLHNYIHI